MISSPEILRRRGWRVEKIEAFQEAERRDLAQSYLRVFGKELTTARLGNFISFFWVHGRMSLRLSPILKHIIDVISKHVNLG